MPFRIGQRVFAPGLYAVAATVAALTGFAGLGTWQLDRAAEKRAVLAEYADGQRTTVALTASAETLPRYQRVTASGRFDAMRQILLDNMPSAAGVPGYQVLTPFLLDDGGIVLVNRGWIPLGRNRGAIPALEVAEEPRRIEGILDRLPVPGMRLGTPAEPAASWPRVLNFPEHPELAALYGPALLEPQLLLDPGAADGFARDWSVRIGVGPLRHVGYAIQWFALGAALIVIFFVVNLKRPAAAKSEAS